MTGEENNGLDDFEEFLEPSLWLEADRKRGILTKNDREYLLGERELEGQDERNARYRIRQRIVQALADLVLIFRELDLDDMDQIANHEQVNVDNTPVALNALAYRLLLYNDNITNHLEQFEEDIIQAVNYGEQPHSEAYIRPKAELDIDRIEYEKEELAEIIQSGDIPIVDAAMFLENYGTDDSRETLRGQTAQYLIDEVLAYETDEGE